MYAAPSPKKALHVNGAPPRAAGHSRLNAQAVRDEVVSRLSEMLQEAELKRDEQVVHANGASPSSPPHRRHAPHIGGQSSKQGQLVLPAISSTRDRHHPAGTGMQHQGVEGMVTSIFEGGGVGDSDVTRTGMPSSSADVAANSLFAVHGNPLSILRQCIKHFLSAPSAYGKNVRALLDEELRYVIDVWATSSTDPADLAEGGGSSLDKGVNIVQDNFFERMVRVETERRRQQRGGGGADATMHRQKDDVALDEFDDGFGQPRSLVPRRPSADDTALSVALSVSGGLVPPPKMPLASSAVRGNNRTFGSSHSGGIGGGGGGGTANENFEVTSLRRKLKALEQMNTVFSEQLNARTMELREAKSERIDVDKQMEKLELKIMQGKREKEALEVQLADLRTSLDDQLLKVTNFRDEEEDKRRTTEERLGETRREMSQVYSELKNAQNQLVASQKELDRAVEECERLQGELDTAHRRLHGATNILRRRNHTLTLMQVLIQRRRIAHSALQQCVKELEVFAGAGTLTELYLASDPAWSAFLYYRLHRHVFHVTANVAVPSVVASAHQLTRDTVLFAGTSEGGAWRVANFSTEHLLRLVLSNNGERRVAMEDNPKAGTTGLVAASPRSGHTSIGNANPLDDNAARSPSHRACATARGGCMGLQWNTSPYQVYFERTKCAVDGFDASLTTAPSLADAGIDSNQHEGQSLDASVSSLAATATTALMKCQPVLCIEALLLPPPMSVVKRLHVPAMLLAAQHRNAMAAGDKYAAETLAALLPPPYQPRCEPVDDTMKLRRSDIRLILYGLWKERYRQYMDHFQELRTAKSDAAKIPKALEASRAAVRPLGSFLTFLYLYLSQRFPLGGSAANAQRGRKQSSLSGAGASSAAGTAAAGVPGYHQPMDAASVAVRAAVGEDRVAYCYLRSKMVRPPADLPLGGKYATANPSNAAMHAQSVDSLMVLSPPAREILCALMHYSYEYKEVDADFRLFYLVSHQMLPEALAINFYAMTEAIYRDCDEAVLGTISEKLAAGVRGQLSPPKRKRRAPSLSSLANASTPPSVALAESVPGAGSLKDLYEEDPLTRLESKSFDTTKVGFGRFDDPSSSEDDECSILADVGCDATIARSRSMRATGAPLDGDASLTSSPNLGPASVSVTASPTHLLPQGRKQLQQQGTVAQGSVGAQRQQSELLQRNGLISLHNFLRVIEKHSFATYQLVKETSSGAGGAHEWEGEVSPSAPSSHRVSPALERGLPGQLPSSDESSSDDDDAAQFDMMQVYREEAHQRLQDDASNASPLYRVGYVPLTSMQAQRLKFALSLDQPSSVVKYASLFRPDTGAARPSHFYDELLTMVIDHHLTIQEVIMDELVLPACRCRHETPVAGAVQCDGDILVGKLLQNTIRWVTGIQPPVAAAERTTKQALYVDIAARRFVLQLCEACPREGTSGQFVDAVLTLPSLALVERFEARHHQVSATLEHFATLPLHHLAAKLRTTLVVFDVAQPAQAQTANAPLPPTVLPLPGAAAVPKGGAAPHGGGTSTSAIVSRIAFQPPPKELMDVFRQAMETACAECDARTAKQRALYNNLVAVLPRGTNAATSRLRGGRTVVAITTDDGSATGGSNTKQYLQLQHTALDAPVGVSAEAVGEGSDNGGANARQRWLNIATLQNAGGDDQPLKPSFRSFYEGGDGEGARDEGAAGQPSEAAAKGPRKSLISSNRKKLGGVTEAIDQAFDAARLAVTTQTLSQIQECKLIPLELGLASMLKRQLSTKFPLALLPPMGDLHVYHKALMTALLKPIDDATEQAPTVPLIAGQGSFSSGDRRKPLVHEEDPAAVAAEAGRSNLVKSASFSFKRPSEDSGQPAVKQRHVPVAHGEGIPEARRRLGSIAMGIYSSLT